MAHQSVFFAHTANHRNNPTTPHNHPDRITHCTTLPFYHKLLIYKHLFTNKKIFHTMKKLFIVMALLCAGMAQAQEYSVVSPDGTLKMNISVANGTMTTYSVAAKDGNAWQTLIAPSEIAMQVQGGITWGVSASAASIAWDTATAHTPRVSNLLFGKTSTLTESYRELAINFEQGYTLTARCYDEGCAYRWSGGAQDAVTRIAAEKAMFTFAQTTAVWYPGMSDSAKQGDDENYERWYTKFNSISAIRSDYDRTNGNDFRWSVTPVLFGLDNGNGIKIAITEADLHHYPALYLQKADNTTMKGYWQKYPRSQTAGDQYTGSKVTEWEDFIAQNTGRHNYPWRVIIVERQDKNLLVNQLVYKLSSPMRGDINWDFVKDAPGKSTWEYATDAMLEIAGVPSGWSNVTAANGFNLYNEYIKLAARYGFEYITIDTDGQHDIGAQNQRRLVDTGRVHGVRVVKWDYIADVRANRYQLQNHKTRGFACIKVDFFFRSDQQGMEWIEELAQDAAAQELTLLLHGCPVPHGLHRTYPNILSYEAVAGEENYKWDPVRTGGRLPTTKYHAEIPFIRQLVGPMDFTPGMLNNVHLSSYQPRSGRITSIGTRAHELSMYVLYDMFIAYLADNPNAYYQNPMVMKYLSKVPTVWDQVIALDGRVGEYAAMAKRRGDAWFVAGMVSEQPKTFNVDFSFLPSGQTYQAYIYKDDPQRSIQAAVAMIVDSMEITSTKTMQISCVLEGGFVIQLYKKGSSDDPNGADETTTSISSKPLAQNQNVRAYYNYGVLTIRSDAGAICNVAVYDVRGALVAQRDTSCMAQQETISIALPAGIYVASVATAAGRHGVKFVVNND
jgi:alpha-glucosidase